MKHIMIDLESLGVSANAAIISIGAVRFDLISDWIDDNAFYASVSVRSNQDLGRVIDESTLIWWLDQSPEAQRVFSEPKISLGDALLNFNKWFDNPDSLVWSNGASFDLPMMTTAYRDVGFEGPPWKFFNERCMRTYKNLPGAKDISVPRTGLHHNALADAMHQAKQLQAIHKALFMKEAR